MSLFQSISLVVVAVGFVWPTVSSEPVAEPSSRLNVLFICVDDLRPELGCYGKSHMYTPHIDQLAAQGRLFSRHYVQVPTCGASRACLLSGRYPRKSSDFGNGAIVSQFQKSASTLPFPQLLRDHGYQTISIGKVSHYPGGRMGPDWNSDDQLEMPGSWDQHLMPCGAWKNPRNAMHGYAGGAPRVRGKTPPVEIKEGGDDLYPDGLIVDSAQQHIERLVQQDQPWLLAVGLIKPHLPFTAPQEYWDLYHEKALPPVRSPGKPARGLTWHSSGEFFRGYHQAGRDPRKDEDYAALVRKHYYASVSYVDAQVGKLLASLGKTGQADKTIVILWGDHGWNLGERMIWGKHCLYEESLHAPLIMRLPGMSHPGGVSTSIVETIDIYPTLCDLLGLKLPSSLDGHSLRPQLLKPEAESDGIARSFWGQAQSLRTDTFRLTRARRKGEVAYDLFKFPESGAPKKGEVDEVVRSLSPQFLSP